MTVIQEVTLPVKLAEFQGYDLILLDIMLTNISGIELCKQLRNQIATPIIFISAKDTEDDILQGLANGGDDYIVKPFSLKQLVAKVEADLKREDRTKKLTANLIQSEEISVRSHFIWKKSRSISVVRPYHLLNVNMRS